ncbi:MAG TPA: DUF3189 family protein [Firmicutes bacterium]|jgi:hypothetical protein|nr:DUF3189 family protein [Bacillota bacterium]
MHVIYHCPHPSFSAVTAAAIHLGLLAPDRKPSLRAIFEIASYFAWKRAKKGIIYPVGIDNRGNMVYLLPRGFDSTILQNVVTGVSRVLGGGKGELALVDTDLSAGRWQWGTLFFCSLGRIAGPRFFPVLEINRIYFALVRLVEQQKG